VVLLVDVRKTVTTTASYFQVRMIKPVCGSIAIQKELSYN